MQEDTTLRDQQLCPGWCDAHDHLETAQDTGEEPRHFAIVGCVGSDIDVHIERPTRLGGGPPIIGLFGFDDGGGEQYAVRLSASAARSVAALLTAAADRVELNP